MIVKTLLTALCLLGLASATSGPASWKKVAALLDSSNRETLILYFRTDTLHRGKAQWKLENRSNKAIYDVGICDKRYYLSNGKTKDRLGESIRSKIAAGTSGTTMFDNIWQPIRGYALQPRGNDGIIRLSLTPHGRKQSWAKYGRVKIYR
jgi:hypothetical protein